MKRSEILSEAIKMMRDAEREYKYAYEQVGLADKMQCDILHDIELNLSYDDRCKSATALKRCLVERRINKDIVEETEPIVEFINSPRTNNVISNLEALLGRIRKEEAYHANRHYVPRVKGD